MCICIHIYIYIFIVSFDVPSHVFVFDLCMHVGEVCLFAKAHLHLRFFCLPSFLTRHAESRAAADPFMLRNRVP